MSDNKETAKHALLKELDDVQSLLDDAEPPLLQASARQPRRRLNEYGSLPANGPTRS